MSLPIPDFLSHLPVITLSKRELLQLLLKLEREDESTCAIVREQDNGSFYVKAISDEEAYAKVGKPPMHPTEAAKIALLEAKYSVK